MSDTASADLEREAERVRAQLSDTADELRARMTPGQIMDEVLNRVRGGDASEMLANLKLQARDNPMALALIGGGVAWLMMGPGVMQRGAAARTEWERQPAYGNADEGATGYAAGWSGTWSDDDRQSEDSRSMVDRATEAAGAAREAVGGAIRDAAAATGERVHGAAEGLRQAAGNTYAGVRQAAGDTYGGLRQAAGDAYGGLRETGIQAGQQARGAFVELLDREPLVVGALGFAMGAAVGAMLPASELERQHLGAAGAALKERTTAMVDEGVTAAKEAAGEIYTAVRDEADREGLLPSEGQITGKLDSVMRAAGDKAEEILHRDDAPDAPDRTATPDRTAAPDRTAENVGTPPPPPPLPRT